LCGITGSPQFEHSTEFFAFNAWCERRMLRTDFEVFLLGTAMINSQYIKKAPDHGRR
jgi:hypothetical protein